MQKKPSSSRSIIPAQGNFIKDIVLRAKLILYLMGDRRVSPWVKLIPIGTLIYWLSPVDLIMGIPGIDALDDLAVIGLGTYMFIELCPPDVVRELSQKLISNNEIIDKAKQQDDGDIIDGEATDVTNQK